MTEFWQTVTHARLRARQGDLAGARLILERILTRNPRDAEARALRNALASDGIPFGTPPNGAGDGTSDVTPPGREVPAAREALKARLTDRARREWGASPATRLAVSRRVARWLDAVRRGSAPSLSRGGSRRL